MNKTAEAEQPESQNHAVKPAISSKGISLARSSNFKRLTKAEFADKRSNGMCFRCDQKFTPGHRCMSPALQVLLVDNENKDDGVSEMAKVSINTLAGWSNNYTLKLRGMLGGEEIVALIDCGASYNLISAKLVERLGIVVMDTAPFGSIIGNGETVYNQGLCKGVIISFPELQVVEDLLHVQMGNTRYFDVILGIKWLKTLGDVMVNWQLLTMTFVTDTGKIKLSGDPDLCHIRAPAKPMANTSKSEKDQISKEVKQHSKLAQEGIKKQENKSQFSIELKGLILYKQRITEAFGLLIKKGSSLYKRKLKEAFGPSLIKKGSTRRAKIV